MARSFTHLACVMLAVSTMLSANALGAASPAGPGCPWDIDGDGIVGFGDLMAVLSAWGPCSECPEDIDGDSDVGFSDLLEILSRWGTPCSLPGACCFVSGECLDGLTAYDCASLDGSFLGEGSVCAGVSCLQCFVDLDVFDGPNAAPLPEVEEDIPGGAIIINGDDDDLDGVIDVGQGGPIVLDPATPGSTDENNLRLIRLEAFGPPGWPVELDAPAGGERIAVYEDELKAFPVGLPAVWSVESLPEFLWVEGTKLSADARDVRMTLTLVGLPCHDGINLTNIDVMSMTGTSSADLERIVCTPHTSSVPDVELAPVSLLDVFVRPDGSVDVTLTGTVHDELADMVAGGLADVLAVDVHANNVFLETVPVALAPEPASLFRPFAFGATFETTINFVPIDGANIIDVLSAPNLVGNEGADSVILEFTIDSIFTDMNPPGEDVVLGRDEESFMSVDLAAVPSAAVIDTFDLRTTAEPDQVYVETASDSLVFEQLDNANLPERITIVDDSGYDPGAADTIEILMEQGGADAGQYVLDETGAATLEFRIDFTGVDGEEFREGVPPLATDAFEEEVVVSLEEITNTEKAGPSTHGPFVIVVDGPVEFIAEVITSGAFRGTTYPVALMENPPRWFFASGGKPAVFAETEKPPAAAAANVNQNAGDLVRPTVYGDEGEELGVLILLPAAEPAPGGPVSPNYGFPGATVQSKITGKGLKTGAVSFGAGITVTVGAGRNDTRVPVTLQIAAGAAAGPRDVQVGAQPAMRRKFVVYKVEVKYLNFTAPDVYTINKNKKDIGGANPELQADFWRASTSIIELEFLSGKHEPAAAVRGTTISPVFTRVEVMPRMRDLNPGGITFDMQGVMSLAGVGGGSITWAGSDLNVVTGTLLAPVFSLQLTTTDALPDKVVKIKKPIQWQIAGPGTAGFADINQTGDHVIYVLYAAPVPFRRVTNQNAAAWTFGAAADNKLTPNRLAKIYEVVPAAGTTDFRAIVDDLHSDIVTTNLRFLRGGGRSRLSDWPLWSTRGAGGGNTDFFGQCAEQARLLQRMTNMIGIKAQHLHVFASRDANCMDFETKRFSIGGVWRTLHLYMDFDGLTDAQIMAAMVPNLNQGEGCLVVPTNQNNPAPDDYRKLGKYYPSNLSFTIQGSATVRGDLGMLRKLADDTGVKQRWMRRRANSIVTWWSGPPTTPEVARP